MKHCPQCGKSYSDDNLNFCLDDGAALVQSFSSTEQETVVLPPTRNTVPQPGERRGVSPVFAYLFVGLLALIAGGTIVGLIMWRSSGTRNAANATANASPNDRAESRNQNTAVQNVNSRAAGSPSPTATPELIDAASARSEVESALNGWLEALTAKNLDRRMQFYADRLETYYTQRGAPASAVRAENVRVLERYSDLNMEISNLDVRVDEKTGEVTTTFDKTFSFEGADRNFTGAVRSEFRWKKIDGRWKIVSERDLKVY